MDNRLLITSKALADETRYSIIRFLSSQEKGCSVKELAEVFSLHPNAVRQHLLKLSEAQLIISESLKGKGSGRPLRIYKKAASRAIAQLIPRDYKLLCEMLLGLVVGKGIGPDEVRAFGKKWGEEWTRRLSSFGMIDRSPQTIARFVSEQFGAWGFEPDIQEVKGGQIRIQLKNCSFKEAVDMNPEVVCPLLHGVLEGMLAPFVGPHSSTLQNGIAHGEDSCLVRIQLRPSGA